MIRLVLSSFFLWVACTNVSTTRVDQPTQTQPDNSDLRSIKLPEGFQINLFAEVPDARSMCLGAQKTLFVGNRSGNKVFAVVDKDQNGIADSVYTIASGLNMPCGVAFKEGNLYVAEVNRILRFDAIEQHLSNPPKPVIIYDQLPADRAHGWKFIAFGPDGKLYIPVGAPCNVCLQQNPVYASITRMNSDGSGFEVFAHGIRNSVGFDWDPQTKQLWFTDNGRDNLGDNLPSDELNHAPQTGMHFGFPFCHQGNTLDPEFGKGKKCDQYTAPVLMLGPHVAALGMRFYTGSLFPKSYQNQIFIAQHGSWNRSTPIGYRIMLVTHDNNKVISYTPFAEGWLEASGKVTGRPVDVQVAPDGSLYVSDDMRGVIYRISYKEKK